MRQLSFKRHRFPPEIIRHSIWLYARFSYQAAIWSKPRRVVAKVEWHPGELYPKVGFIVTDLSRPAARVTKFYSGRGTAEQWIKGGKNAINWTRLSCHSFRNNDARLQLQALATISVTSYELWPCPRLSNTGP